MDNSEESRIMLKRVRRRQIRPHCSIRFESEIVVVLVCIETCARSTGHSQRESASMTAQRPAAAAAGSNGRGTFFVAMGIDHDAPETGDGDVDRFT
jgi:hypothetical protein